ncbi:MAG: DNA-directed RNA polymerase subunit beta' [Armatimonadetes bacterium]|nr:DNA-directed RNA polymerase subunit beta' [Armatimonadota bacterium]MDW8122861.1 DNA-directed RNA polymerase subunit beta' [Armatimonadota bacterium]
MEKTRERRSVTFDAVRIGLASPQDIRSWSKGEVKRPETINYRTFRPEKDGLFDERIFGPTKDYECACGRYKKRKYAGITCERCGVEVTTNRVRRRRMGHIELSSPVAHFWFVRSTPSPLALLLDLSPKLIERVVYLISFIVTKVDRQKINEESKNLKKAVKEECEEIDSQIKGYIANLRKEQESYRQKAAEGELPSAEADELIRSLQKDIEAAEQEAEERKKRLEQSLQLLSDLEAKQPLSPEEYHELKDLLERASRKLGRNLDHLFRAGTGAEAIRELLDDLDLEQLVRELRRTVQETTGPKRARAIRRLEIAEAFRKSRNLPSWMILEVLPVLPPDLRPMVQLDGGRFATSDLNDLYRRVINRNNRLKKMREIRAPDSIINHEKRLLQEAVDALLDNSRKPRPVVGTNGRPLKSLSDMLRGKEGRFRRNLLGKRVDYSGRSVIVVGPQLKLGQCGLPRVMARELFRPFLMHWLERNSQLTGVHTIRNARRLLEEADNPAVHEALENVVVDHPVLLNRAPTLHRLGIQAFLPVLVEGKAIQIHPLVCPPFNADFDGDAMAVHIPLSVTAQAEARLLMMATNNIFSPANGQPLMSPGYDIALGCYYLTQLREFPEEKGLEREAGKSHFPDLKTLFLWARHKWIGLEEVVFVDGRQEPVWRHLIGFLAPEGKVFPSAERVLQLLERKALHWQDDILVRHVNGEGRWILTTAGRVLFNSLLPPQIPFQNETITKGRLRDLVVEIYEKCGNARLVQFLDDVKDLGFHICTESGITLSVADLQVETRKAQLIEQAEKIVEQIEEAYSQGLMGYFDREERIYRTWMGVITQVTDEVMSNIGRFNPLYMMADSGARGRKEQMVQLAGLRGLMTTALGTIISDLPVKRNLRDGLSLLEYFVCTFSARRTLADTALRTSDAGYLTRRLVDVAQDVVIKARDCGTTQGFEMTPVYDETGNVIVPLADRIFGRIAAANIRDPKTRGVLVREGEMITREKARAIEEAGVRRVVVRSPLTCELPHGICATCYGMDLSSGKLVELGEAVGIIAAQSIGEPGTQFTLRTFHLVIGQGLVEIRQFKGHRERALREIIRYSRGEMTLRDMMDEIKKASRGTEEEQKEQRMKWWTRLHVPRRRGLLRVEELFDARKPLGQAIVAEYKGKVVRIDRSGIWRVYIDSEVPEKDWNKHQDEVLAQDVRVGDQLLAVAETKLSDAVIETLKEHKVPSVIIRKAYVVPFNADFKVKVGQEVEPGDPLTEGAINPFTLLSLKGVRAVQDYLLREIQSVYRSHGLDIHDKHVEIIIRQMLRKRRITDPGDTDFLPGQVVDRAVFELENARVRQQGLKEATADWVLMGIMKAAESTDSWLSAASFQRTTQALTDAAIRGKADYLVGLKENVIIGHLIPAGTGFIRPGSVEVLPPGQEPLPHIAEPEEAAVAVSEPVSAEAAPKKPTRRRARKGTPKNGKETKEKTTDQPT